MNITRDEARQSLTAIRQITAQTRRAVVHGGGPYFMFIWGAVWFLGFLADYILPPSSTLLSGIWLTLDGVAAIATVVVGVRQSRRVRSPFGSRIGLFWLALLGYGALLIWLARPTSDEQMSLMIATMAMFGYVVIGLWLSRIFIGVGITITALALLGYYLLPAYFDLWMAFLGGGTLIGSGVYILRRWK